MLETQRQLLETLSWEVQAQKEVNVKVEQQLAASGRQIERAIDVDRRQREQHR
jgi:hypothetical protein